jgi:hypothetical protein
MLRKHVVRILVLCLIAMALGSCRTARTKPTCTVPAIGACKGCVIACPVGQTPVCTAGKGDETNCSAPATCTCQ